MMLDTRWQPDANWAAHSDDVFTISNAVNASGNTPTAVKSAALALSSRLALPMHVGPSRPLLSLTMATVIAMAIALVITMTTTLVLALVMALTITITIAMTLPK